MKRTVIALVIASALAAGPAFADDLSLKDATGATQRLCAVSQSNGSVAPCHALVNKTGAQVNPATDESVTAIQAAPGTNALKAGAMQGVDGGKPLMIAGRADSLALVNTNVAAAAQTAIGGRYILSAVCSTWVTNGLTFRYRGPDGATMIPQAQYSANTAVEIGMASGAVVDAVVAAGSAGCNLTVARIPQ